MTEGQRRDIPYIRSLREPYRAKREKEDENDSIRGYLTTLSIRREETITGALALGYPDGESALPNRVPKLLTGNGVIYVK